MASALPSSTIDLSTSSAPSSAASALRYPPSSTAPASASAFMVRQAEAAGPAHSVWASVGATRPDRPVTVTIDGERVEVMASDQGETGTKAPTSSAKAKMAKFKRKVVKGCKKHWKKIALIAFIVVIAALAICVATGQFGENGGKNPLIASSIVLGGLVLIGGAYLVNHPYRKSRHSAPKVSNEQERPFISGDVYPPAD